MRAATPEERRSAHLALAEALTGEPARHAWHLAEAATGPDEAVAQALETAALSISCGGRTAAAVDPLVRAGELSPNPADRSRRLIEAAYIASATGPLDRVTRLLADARRADDARQASGTPTSLVFASATAAYLMYGQGQVDAAHRLLAGALADSDTSHANCDWTEDVLYSLLNASIFGGRQELWRLLGDALARFDPDGRTAVRLCYDALVDTGPAPRRVREGLLSALDTLPADAPPWRLIPLAFAAMGTDTLGEYRHLCRSMIDRELDCGAVGAAITGLLVLSGDSYHSGQWDEAEELARQGLDLAAALGYQLLECHLRVHLAFVAATRGQAEVARALSDEVSRWAAPRGLGNTQAFAWYARALTALGQGDYEEAYLQATRLNRDGAFAPSMISSWTVMDFVEAAVRTGRIEEARAHVAAAQRAGTADMSPRRAMSSLGAAALAAPDDRAGPLFEAALSMPDADRWPFEQARIQLAYGQWLRRTRDTARARLHLRAALETLDRLGARPWAVRAHNELRAAGVAEAVSPDSRAVALTTQERRIATLAAGGLTNKQIGQKLYLSHRTVSGHLHRIFPKLGITSRAALRDALGAEASPEPDAATDQRRIA
ncbi:LuxR C-terminal-related transcriptional regulator [Dactylosporangium darangshiense]|uniref:LuxR C-terminal-related transcriptional regulator n=1 Tax=Dactylosporangium darangshiense TaxID=579108 RepID=UPI003625CC1B